MTLGEAIKRPFTEFNKLIIGILISSIPIVNFISVGYFLKCYKTARTKDFELPEWKNIWNLFSEGSFAFLIILIYFLPFIISIKLMGLGYVNLMQIKLIEVIQLFESINSLLNVSILITLILIPLYMIPISLKKYALTKKITEVFCKEVLRNALKIKYLTTWILGVLLTIIITILFSFIPYIGFGIILFLTGTIFSTYYGVKND